MPQEYIESQDVDNDVMSKDFWEQYKKEAQEHVQGLAALRPNAYQ